MNRCPDCGRPVKHEGETCSRECYADWIRRKQDQTARLGLIVVEDDEVVPLNLSAQPWWLAEFDEDSKPKMDSVPRRREPSRSGRPC